jgi:hypothetical protein
MTRDWDQQFQEWVKLPGKTEQERCGHAASERGGPARRCTAGRLDGRHKAEPVLASLNAGRVGSSVMRLPSAAPILAAGALALCCVGCQTQQTQHASGIGAVPSDFVSRTALANPLHANIRVLAKNPIIALIRRRQFAPEKTAKKAVARERRAA